MLFWVFHLFRKMMMIIDTANFMPFSIHYKYVSIYKTKISLSFQDITLSYEKILGKLVAMDKLPYWPRLQIVLSSHSILVACALGFQRQIHLQRNLVLSPLAMITKL